MNRKLLLLLLAAPVTALALDMGGARAWQLPPYITEIESAQGIIRSDERFQQTALE